MKVYESFKVPHNRDFFRHLSLFQNTKISFWCIFFSLSICVAIKRNLAPESILSQANLASESILSRIEFCLLKHFIPNRILSLKTFYPKQNLSSEVILIINRVSTIESIIDTNRNFAEISFVKLFQILNNLSIFPDVSILTFIICFRKFQSKNQKIKIY